MSNIVTGANLPADLMAVLKKYGLPERVTSFKIWCDGPLGPVNIQCSYYAREPAHSETFAAVEETRIFKLMAVE